MALRNVVEGFGGSTTTDQQDTEQQEQEQETQGREKQDRGADKEEPDSQGDESSPKESGTDQESSGVIDSLGSAARDVASSVGGVGGQAKETAKSGEEAVEETKSNSKSKDDPKPKKDDNSGDKAGTGGGSDSPKVDVSFENSPSSSSGATQSSASTQQIEREKEVQESTAKENLQREAGEVAAAKDSTVEKTQEFVMSTPSATSSLLGQEDREEAIEDLAREGSPSAKVFVGGEVIEAAGVRTTQVLDEQVPEFAVGPKVGLPGSEGEEVGTQVRNVAVDAPAGVGVIGSLAPRAAADFGLAVEDAAGKTDVSEEARSDAGETGEALQQGGETVAEGIQEEPIGAALEVAAPGVGGRFARGASGRVPSSPRRSFVADERATAELTGRQRGGTSSGDADITLDESNIADVESRADVADAVEQRKQQRQIRIDRRQRRREEMGPPEPDPEVEVRTVDNRPGGDYVADKSPDLSRSGPTETQKRAFRSRQSTSDGDLDLTPRERQLAAQLRRESPDADLRESDLAPEAEELTVEAPGDLSVASRTTRTSAATGSVVSEGNERIETAQQSEVTQDDPSPPGVEEDLQTGGFLEETTGGLTELYEEGQEQFEELRDPATERTVTDTDAGPGSDTDTGVGSNTDTGLGTETGTDTTARQDDGQTTRPGQDQNTTPEPKPPGQEPRPRPEPPGTRPRPRPTPDPRPRPDPGPRFTPDPDPTPRRPRRPEIEPEADNGDSDRRRRRSPGVDVDKFENPVSETPFEDIEEDFEALDGLGELEDI